MIKTNADDLTYKLQMLQPAIAAGSSTVDTQYVYFKGVQNEIPIMHTYNRIMSITMNMAATTSEDFEALVEHERLYNYISNHEAEDEILLDFSEPGRLVVRTSRGEAEFKAETMASYRMRKVDASILLGTINADALARIIDGAASFLPKTKASGMLDALHFYFDPNNDRVVVASQNNSICSRFETSATIRKQYKIAVQGTQLKKVRNYPGESDIKVYTDRQKDTLTFKGEHGMLTVSTLTQQNRRIDKLMSEMQKPRTEHIKINRDAFRKSMARISSWDVENIKTIINSKGFQMEVRDRTSAGAREEPLTVDASRDFHIFLNFDHMQTIAKLSSEDDLRIILETVTWSAVVGGKTGSVDYKILFAVMQHKQSNKAKAA